ncbi:endonuclease/exonuclease/phosphatase family protein [Paenibacillus doosanensis]|uniref:Endonuclease/Exonuclease/phosphatase family protein n=1 Tax=Paenibacillus konkukensis TaxID=2020716 RepID=A0ABY4S371_9BACL|nr:MULTISPECIES: endonuclease/exonuclease/phosphatase family protein [Paenibacillus]MCS7463345.1 endonuclease/exonuclease/phosphatase family protein [Paenibacillus doosanensis]UQZ87652.1 Endonuclease/Exonuclease/phosphatase family protein [Paenibacillus konkukensis]
MPLTIMTFNLRTAAAKDDHPWEQRRPVIKQMLASEKPDLIGTQEGIAAQLADLQEDLPGYGRIGVGREGGDLGEYMAIFYNQERLKPLEQDHFWLSATPDVISSATWGNRIPRMVSWVRFQDTESLNTFYMVDTHLDHELETARLESAQLILDAMQSFAPNIPVILTGDFNSNSGGGVYRVLTGPEGLKDAFADAAEKVNGDIGTFHNYTDPTAGGSGKRIDWILYRGQADVSRGETVTYHTSEQYPSDHYPVTVRLTLHDPDRTAGETTVKRQHRTKLLLTELVANSASSGNYNYVEVYNPGDEPIDLEGYKLYYYYDPAAPFDKAKANKWTIAKDAFSTSSVIEPHGTKAVWIKKQPCCYQLGIDDFRSNYGLTEEELPSDRLLAVFTPGENQGFNGTATTGRSVSIVSPDGAHLVGASYNQGVLDVKSNESVVFSPPAPLSSIMKKEAAHQKPSPGMPPSGM